MTRQPSRRPSPRNPEDAPQRRRSSAPRLSQSERRARILDTAYDFFAANGLNADTRALANACGISQRLLYKVFPNKSALLNELYRMHIAGPVKESWFDQLRDRSKPVEERLIAFCRDYYDSVLTSRWLRLFLSAALADTSIASAYQKDFVARLLEITVEEAAHEMGLQVPEDRDLVCELGWILHGAVSHLAVRRHIYQTSPRCPAEDIIALQARCFLSGLSTILPARRHYAT